MPGYTIGVLEDAIEVLELFLERDHPLTFTQIHKASGLSKSKAFRILTTLEERSFLQRDDAGCYRLGLCFLAYGQRAQRQLNLLEASRPVLDWLVHETNESIFLGVIDGTEALCVDARQSPHSIRLYAEVGRRAPLYAGSIPKVLLAYLPTEERDEILQELELEPITPFTLTNLDDLKEVLHQIRQQGYVVTSDDLDLGACSIGAPIFDQSSRVVAAISVAGPAERIRREGTERHIELVCEAARRISRTLGHVSSPSPPQNRTARTTLPA